MSKRSRRFALAMTATLGLMAGPPQQARADLNLTFNAEGTFDDGATLGGTVTIDTTIGTVVAANLTVSAPDSLDLTFVQGQRSNLPVTGDYQFDVGPSASEIPAFDVSLPVATLVDYPGGPIGSDSQPANNFASVLFLTSLTDLTVLQEGSLSLTTPEPSTFWMAVCGISGGLAFARFRSRRGGGERGRS
jgi:hypothetical protein